MAALRPSPSARVMGSGQQMSEATDLGDTTASPDLVQDLQHGKAKGHKKHKRRKRGQKKKKAPKLLPFEVYKILKVNLDRFCEISVKSYGINIEWSERRAIWDLLYRGRVLSKTVKVNQTQYYKLLSQSIKGCQWILLMLERMKVPWERDFHDDKQAQYIKHVLSHLRNGSSIANGPNWAFPAPVPDVRNSHKRFTNLRLMLPELFYLDDFVDICEEYNMILGQSQPDLTYPCGP